MSSILEALKDMERPILRTSQLADAIQCLADAIDHDPRLADALHGVGSAIENAMEQIEQSCLTIRGQV